MNEYQRMESSSLQDAITDASDRLERSDRTHNAVLTIASSSIIWNKNLIVILWKTLNNKKISNHRFN